jgi:hypothetical protein
MTYTAIIDEVQKLTFDDKLMLREILEKYLIEEKRNQIFENGKEAIELAKKGELAFTSDINEMKKILNESL